MCEKCEYEYTHAEREDLMHSQSAVTTAGQKYICLGGKNGEQMRFVIQER